MSSVRSLGQVSRDICELKDEVVIKYESYETGLDNFVHIYLDRWFAQTFTPGISHGVIAVGLYLKKNNSPVADLTVDITAVDGIGKPSGAALTSGGISSEDVDVNYAWVTCSMPSYPLSGGTTYAIVCHCAGSDEVNHYVWGMDSSLSAYTGGQVVYSYNGGSSWFFAIWDFLFAEYGAGGPIVQFLLA